ncbi:MAG: sulfite exporter TauE/SafE family protein [Patescibacteria group bacterium]
MEIVAIFITFILAGIATELTGFGVATISMALLPFFFPVSVAVPVVVMISTTSTGIVALKTKTTGLWKHMLSLVAGSAIGVPLGILMLNNLNEDLLKVVLAIFLITYSVYGLLKRQTFIKATVIKSTVVGTIAGFSSALLSIHGPIVGSYSSANKSFNRNETRDIIATYMFFAGVFTVAGHYLSGNITDEVVNNFLYALPFLLLGILIGSIIFKKMNELSVRKFIYIFILAAGMLMII